MNQQARPPTNEPIESHDDSVLSLKPQTTKQSHYEKHEPESSIDYPGHAGNLDPVVKLLSEKMEHGLREHFKEAVAKRKFDQNDIEAGREFVKAYVEYIHYVEGLYDAAASAAHGHFSETDGTPASPHQHKQ
jgi:hypothetical protein